MPSRSDRDGLLEEITISLLRIINKIEHGRRVPRDYGGVSMTLLEAQMCGLIFRNDGITGGELADELGVTRSATSQVVAKLKSKDLVEEQPNPADAKRKRLYVTDHGRAAALSANEYQSAMGRALFGTASQAEAKAYVRFVKRLEAYHAAVVDQWDPTAGDGRQ
jgi:DNA-binding MarR family transcriptional regulator